jgi:hypothetical protein
MYSWSTFGAWRSHEQTWTHKTHHGLKLGEAITFLLIIYSVFGHESNTQMSFCPRTSNPSFGHNLCFRHPNEPCELISNIYVPRSFQWYKEFFNPMSFDPNNRFLKIWKSIGIPIPKVRTHLGVWRSNPWHFFTLSGAWNVTPKLILGLHFCKPLFWSRTQD